VNDFASPTLVTEWAPAKVNLYLHVGPAGQGGFHPLDSFVMFADKRASDRVGARQAPHLKLHLTGPGARALKSPKGNLVLEAAQLLREACGRTMIGASLVLHKDLPTAGGVGGGSADAAATLRLLNAMWEVGFSLEALETMGAQIGSDVPACVRSRPLVMRGAGEQLIEATAPDLPAVLVNPGVPLETRKVFKRFDKLAAVRAFEHRAPPEGSDAASFALAVASYRNDLEEAARALRPEIGRVLTALSATPGCRLARMSGSGPTCFALYDTESGAIEAAARLSAEEPRYWVRPTVLRGSSTSGPGMRAS
jgi:4-diphosphocytidyl-2-C-methyl-D-erythritol kinase